jgi:hypothetical protein
LIAAPHDGQFSKDEIDGLGSAPGMERFLLGIVGGSFDSLARVLVFPTLLLLLVTLIRSKLEQTPMTIAIKGKIITGTADGKTMPKEWT